MNELKLDWSSNTNRYFVSTDELSWMRALMVRDAVLRVENVIHLRGLYLGKREDRTISPVRSNEVNKRSNGIRPRAVQMHGADLFVEQVVNCPPNQQFKDQQSN